MDIKYYNKVYSGVLGKILGVYLGRPVEGWEFEDINREFGEVYTFKNEYTGAPLVVPDDDISGTFSFYRALKDNNFKKISAENIGDTWLNYIIEDKTILWWGGLSRSTEHTAYLRLKNGVKAPMSGSQQLNGKTIAEQIGSQIFIDTWALMTPNDPNTTAYFAREAASVSHDGIAIEAAVFLAVMESLAFEIHDPKELIKRGLNYVESDLLKNLVVEVVEQCKKASDWVVVRQWIADNHGYDKYPGGCPMVTNHLVVIMALLMAGDDLHKSIMIATSAGWDTDCNAGNVGALNGIRLGISAFDKVGNLRRDVADRMYVVSADGGSCITDAVIETRKLIETSNKFYGNSYDSPGARYNFEFPGSVQGFVPIELKSTSQALTRITNANTHSSENGLEIQYENLGPGTSASFGIDTFVDLQPKGKEGTSYFDVIASPIIYSTQKVNICLTTFEDGLQLQPFFVHFDGEDHLHYDFLESIELSKNDNHLKLEVPDYDGHSIFELGFKLVSDKYSNGKIVINEMDFSQEPRNYKLGTARDLSPSMTPWTTETAWSKMFVSSANHFAPDYMFTFAISHIGPNGVVTIGNSSWKDYGVASKITLGQQEGAGLVGRSVGHRNYYAGMLREGRAEIVLVKNGIEKVLTSATFDYQLEHAYNFNLQFKGNQIRLLIDDKEIVTAIDNEYVNGGCGFIVDNGLIQATGFEISKS